MTPTLTDLLDALGRQFADGSFNGYLPREIPHELDDRVRAVLRSFLAAPDDERVLLACLPRSSVFLLFAEREASRAVRQRSPELLMDAAIAIGMAAVQHNDEREGVMVMPVVWHAAAQLGVAQAPLFTSAANQVPEAGAKALLDFLTRKPENQTLKCMGYREGADHDGFRFVRDW
jgi:hypothetical protein